MFHYVKTGWIAATKQPFIMLILFIYRLGWGLLLYGLIQSVIVPLLHRYPLSNASAGQMQLFYAEGQFRLLNTPLIHPISWVLFILLCVRMALTPLFNAGIYFSLQQTHLNGGYRFFKGIRQLGKAFVCYYVAQTVIVLSPLYWLIPHWAEMLINSDSLQSAAMSILPELLVYLMFGSIIYLVFMYLQFGIAQSCPWHRSLVVILGNLIPIAGIWLILFIVLLILSLLSVTAIWIWAGFWTLLLYQIYRFALTFLNLWGISAQFMLFSAKV